MPLYEYRCPDCDLRFENLRGIGDSDKPVACASCGSQSYRVMSICNFRILEPVLVLQEQPRSKGGGVAEIDRINHAPKLEPSIPYDLSANLVEV